MITTTAAPVRIIAQWADEDGCTYVWPQALVDNRRSRVLARIARYGIACDPSTLVLRRPSATAE